MDMKHLNKKSSNYNTDLGKEFAALSCLCVAGYLSLVLI